MRPNTDVHDYQVRLRAAEKFIAKGNKVKLSLQFRGREMEFRDIGQELIEVGGRLWVWVCYGCSNKTCRHILSTPPHPQRFVNDLGDAATVEMGPKMVGRTMAVIIAPRKVVAP